MTVKRQHIQTQTQWEEEMSEKIMNQVKNELYLDLRYLNIALSALILKRNDSLAAFATDGIYINYNPSQLIRVYKNNPLFLNRAYLHTVLHCLFAHLWIGGERNRSIWSIACDIAVEYTIDGIEKASTKRIVGWIRQRTYKLIDDRKMYSAAIIYRWLITLDDEKIVELGNEFMTDDHHFWPKEENESATPSSGQDNWNRISRQTKMENESRKDEQSDSSSMLASQIKADNVKRSYGDFLRKFMVMREELKCDPDEFDLGYYSYGLSLYKNMPLIEPLETKEVRKIQEFVIVVDTSYSTSGELVKNFLKETFSILSDKENFFKNSRIRIIQSDNKVQADNVISSMDDLSFLFSEFEIKGGGGTDFRPAFEYVNELIENGVIRKLGGLLYFTDGNGVYPKKRPEYKAAFLFLNDYDKEKVPPWAIKLKVDEEDFMCKKTHDIDERRFI